MAEDIYTVALGLNTSQVQQGSQQAQQALRAFDAQAKATQQALLQFAQSQTVSSQSTRDLSSPIQSQTQAYAQAQAATLAYKQAQDQAREATRQASQEASKAGDVLRTAFGVAGGLGIATGVQQLIAGVKEFASEAVQAAVKAESLSASFAAISGGARQGQATLAALRQEAGRIGIDFTSTATAFKGIDAAARGTTLEGDKAKQIFIAMSEASRVLGLSAQETSRILVAVQQIISKNTVSSEELRLQIGESLPGAFQIAARSMGVTTTELDKMLKAGTLLLEDFLPKFAAQIRQEFGPGLAASAQTAAATFARLGNETKALSESVGSSIVTLLKPIADFTAKTLQAVREVSDKTAQARAQAGASALAGKPVFGTGTTLELAAGFTEDEANRAQKLAQGIVDAKAALAGGASGFVSASAQQERVTQLEAEFRALNDVIKARTALTKQQEMANSEEDARGKAGQAQAEALTKQKKATDDLTASQKQFTQAQKDAAQAAKDFPAAYNVLTEREKVLEKQIDATRQTVEANPSLRALPATQQLMAAQNAQLAQVQAQIKAEEERKDAAEKAKREAEKEAKERAKDPQYARETIDSLIARGVKADAASQLAALDKLSQMAAATGLTPPENKVRIAEEAAAVASLNDELAQQAAIKLEIVRKGEAIVQAARDEAALQKQISKQASQAADDAARTASAGHDYFNSLNTLRTLQEQYGLSGAGGITGAARAYTRAQAGLAGLEGTPLADEAQALLARMRTAAEQARPELKQLQDAAQQMADSVLNSLGRLATEGGASFKSFANSLISDMLRIVQQTYLTPVLSGLIKAGIQALPGLRGPSAAVSGGVPIAGVEAGSAALSGLGGSVPTSDVGSLAVPGRPVAIGSNVRELFIPSSSGTIMNEAQLASTYGSPRRGGVGDVHVHVYGVNDAESFKRSEGEIKYRMAQAARGLGSAA